ncbi:MAG: hypothetical protein HYV09_10450 [Deltaproteobacteria bacterium]|nr:hypothetical protein [Deltaproteobacteria bacterium]
MLRRLSFVLLTALTGCRRAETPRTDAGVSPQVTVDAHTALARDARTDARTDAHTDAHTDAPGPADDVGDAGADATRAQTGPFSAPFLGTREVWWIAPHRAGRQRLMAMLHGVCNPPAYTCGLWAETAKELGFLVCPEGDGKCPAAMYGAPTWNEPDTKIDEDLDRAIATVEAYHPGELARDAPVLLGFSRGAYAAVKIAAAHPGRWPYLVIVEATPAPTAKQLRAAGVRAVALVAGEKGAQLSGQRKIASALAADGFPAKVWVMPGAGHHYSSDADVILRDAVRWVTSFQGDATTFAADAGQ